MDPVVAAILVGLGGAFYGFTVLVDRYERRAERVQPDPSLERDVLGKLGQLPEGLAVSVSDRRGAGGRCARIVVSGVCPAISIALEAAGDVELGDPLLDRQLGIRGPRSLLSAMMDAQTRSALLALARTFQIRDESLVVAEATLRVDAWRDPMSGIVAVARSVVALGGRLQAPADVPARLAANALHDPLRGVRLENLRALLRDHAGQPVTLDTLNAAAGHADPELRLTAARALGEPGRPVLAALARDTTIDDETSSSAMEALDAVPVADVEAVLAASLGRGRGLPAARPFTARACADLLAKGGAAAVPLLADVVQSGSESVALAGVRALRQIGTFDVVLPLRGAIAVGGLSVREAARRALDDIHSGVAATPGAVSLAGGEAGQVSVVEDPAGRVSLPGAGRKGP